MIDLDESDPLGGRVGLEQLSQIAMGGRITTNIKPSHYVP